MCIQTKCIMLYMLVVLCILMYHQCIIIINVAGGTKFHTNDHDSISLTDLNGGDTNLGHREPVPEVPTGFVCMCARGCECALPVVTCCVASIHSQC